MLIFIYFFFFFSSRRRHTRFDCDWSSDVCSSDLKKIGLWGGSYGGFLTALGLARNSDIFAAGVDFHGVHDWSVNVAGLRVPTDTAERSRVARESSPISSVDKWRSPVLLIHGDDDRNVEF